MQASDFILIQLRPDHKFYEVARIRPHFKETGEFDEQRGFYCEGFGQNNGELCEFGITLGRQEADINPAYKHKIIPYPSESKIFDRSKLLIE